MPPQPPSELPPSLGLWHSSGIINIEFIDQGLYRGGSLFLHRTEAALTAAQAHTAVTRLSFHVPDGLGPFTAIDMLSLMAS